MNTNPNAKRILCFGDSNTQGVIPGDLGRFPANVRWTGILQNELGDEFEVIEEGLWGRTTNLDDSLPNFEDKNGKEYLYPALRTHEPLETVILWLGSCDLKEYYKREPKDVALAIEELIQMINENTDGAKIVLVSPPVILKRAVEIKPTYEGSPKKSKHLAPEYEKVAKQYGCEFIDIAKHVTASEVDGIHLDKAEHVKVGKLLAKYIK